jgi:hypothetical protein
MKDYIAFMEYVQSMGFVCEFNDETNEYEVTTHRVMVGNAYGAFVLKGGDLVASIPAHMARRNFTEAKQLIKVGLDLQNCFAH